MINTQYFKLDIKKPTLPRIRTVNGDTANRFVITVTDDDDAVTLDASLHKIIAVFTRADGEVYTQDANTGLSFTAGGVVTIDVRPASFRTGTNKVCLQIYKRENSSATTYPLLCTTCEAQFQARNSAIPDSGAENAPSQLPMLEQLIADAGTATTNANNAADAANAAAAAAARSMYLIPHTTEVWDGSNFTSSGTDTVATLQTIMANSALAMRIKMNDGNFYTAYEYYRKADSSLAYLRGGDDDVTIKVNVDMSGSTIVLAGLYS